MKHCLLIIKFKSANLIKFVLFMLLLKFSSICIASECENFDSIAQNEMGFHPPLSAQVIADAKTYFHSAPSLQCKNNDIFIIRDDTVVVYNKHNEWLYVMYINKSGDYIEGWVLEKRLKILGKYAP